MKRLDLKAWRVGKDLKQVEVAEALGVTVAYYNQIELGKIKPSLKLMIKFKEVYKFDTYDEVLKLFRMI